VIEEKKNPVTHTFIAFLIKKRIFSYMTHKKKCSLHKKGGFLFNDKRLFVQCQQTKVSMSNKKRVSSDYNTD
jgi:hypothetical protein